MSGAAKVGAAAQVFDGFAPIQPGSSPDLHIEAVVRAGSWPRLRLTEASFTATCCDATLLTWITSVQPRLANAQSIDAAAASVA